MAPFPTLTASNFTAPGNTFDSNGVFTKTLTTIPPQFVTVTSSKGGSATAPVSVGVPDPLIITTAETLPDYAIGSLYNQLISASGGVPPYTWSSSVSGTLPPGINFFSSSGRLFGTPTSFGIYSFSLQVTDSLGTITTKPFTLTSSTPPNPVAVADTATTTAGSTIVINVLANDTSPVSTINPATVSVSAATGGSAVANFDGTVSYTAPASAGTYTFTYAVKDNSVAPLASNAAVISVTVTIPLPVAPSLLTPFGTAATTTPTYTFNAVAGAATYDIYVWDYTAGTGSVVAASVSPATAGCPGNVGVCSIPQPTALTDGGVYDWFARAQNSAGAGPWSALSRFTVSTVVAPVAPTLLTPVGTAATTTPTYTFDAVAGAATYDIFVWDYTAGSGAVVATSVSPATAGCPGNVGVCSIPQPTALTDGGMYDWFARAKNSAGIGPWSTLSRFKVSTVVAPVAPTLLTPVGTAETTTPTYTFSAVAGAATYDIYVWDYTAGTGAVVAASVSPATAGCPGNVGVCSIPQPTALTNGGLYDWFARAQNSAGVGPWSTLNRFTVQ